MSAQSCLAACTPDPMRKLPLTIVVWCPARDAHKLRATWPRVGDVICGVMKVPPLPEENALPCYQRKIHQQQSRQALPTPCRRHAPHLIIVRAGLNRGSSLTSSAAGVSPACKAAFLAAALVAVKLLSRASCPGIKACAVCDNASPKVAKKKNTRSITCKPAAYG